MAKQLKINYNDKEYTLEFTRKTVAQMEGNGFVAADVETKPMTTLPLLFEGAFLAHHRWVKKDVIDEIFDHITNKEDLIGKLAEMYAEPILSLVEDPEESEGNASWTTSWQMTRCNQTGLMNQGASETVALLPFLIQTVFMNSSPIIYRQA